jgi:hypothetical protein
MPKAILMDQFHLSVFAPRGLPTKVYDGIARALDDRRLQQDLRRAVRDVVGRYPALAKARVTVTR